MSRPSPESRHRKLTVEDVLEARLLAACGQLNAYRFAKERGISYNTVINAVEGKSFKWLPMPPKHL